MLPGASSLLVGSIVTLISMDKQRGLGSVPCALLVGIRDADERGFVPGLTKDRDASR